MGKKNKRPRSLFFQVNPITHAEHEASQRCVAKFSMKEGVDDETRAIFLGLCHRLHYHLMDEDEATKVARAYAQGYIQKIEDAIQAWLVIGNMGFWMIVDRVKSAGDAIHHKPKSGDLCHRPLFTGFRKIRR